MSMAKIQLVDPALGKDGGRIVPALGDLFVAAGEVIDVPDDVAGAGPRWRAATPDDDLSFMETHHDDDPKVGTTVRDLGHGLLAQTDIWARAAEPAPATAKED
jgi:hypothetical protein